VVFPITITRVLKGPANIGRDLPISFTALVYRSHDHDEVVLTPKNINAPVFNVHKIGPRVPFEGAPKPGVAYVFFLQNRKARDPGSYQSSGGQEIIYNNFDFTSGMISARHAVVAQIETLVKAG
jgi:hypothetical protein